MLRLSLKFFILYSFVGFGFWSLLGPNDLESAICIGNILLYFFLGFLYTYACIKNASSCDCFQSPLLKRRHCITSEKDLRNICISPIISLNNNTSRYLHYKIVCETEFFFLQIYIFLGCSMYIFFRLILISPWVKVLDIS